MRKWKVSEAKAKLSALLSSCGKEPQLICNREKPVAAVLNIKLFNEFVKLKETQNEPTISDLLEELRSIQRIEIQDLEIPVRRNRINTFESESNELAF